MKQICKRLSAIFLALTLVSGAVLTTGLVVNADVHKELFRDDFSYTQSTDEKKLEKMRSNGWNIGSTQTTRAGYNTGTEYLIPANVRMSMGTSRVAGSSTWTDYSVEARLTFVKDDAASGATLAGISGRLASQSLETGYDLTLVKVQPSHTGGKLYLRCNGDNLLTASLSRLDFDTPYDLKLEFKGKMLYAYLNGELQFGGPYDTSNDSTQHAAGWAGICKDRTTGNAVKFDNFVVSQVIDKDYPDKHLYYNNFNTEQSLADAGIVTDSTDEDATKISDGYLFLEKGKKAYLANVVDSATWENYTVESEVQIVSNGQTGKSGYAGVIARSNHTNEDFYEYRIQYKTNGKALLQLYKRQGGESPKLSSKDYEISGFNLDTPYKLTMDVHNDGNNVEIMCWITDCSKPLEEQTKVLVFDVVDEKSDSNTPLLKGYAGVRSSGGSLGSKYDNFAVKAYQPPTITYPEGYSYCNDFSSKMRLTNEGWSSDDGTKENGVYVLEPKQSNYLTNVAGSPGWTDYVVEADVMINYSDSDLFDQYAAIVGRSTNKSKTGYELRLIRREDGDIIRLFKKGADDWKINGEDHTAYITLEQGKMNALKMVFKGADIYCYLNGEIVFEVTDNNDPYLEGYAGVISQGGTVSSTYDNFVVREIQSTDFPADAVYPEGYLYYNDFSALRALHNEGWRSKGTKKDGFYILNGESYNYLTKVEGSSEWADYVVEADVVLHDNGEYPQYTSIVARCSEPKTDGYELRLITESEGNTMIRLQKQGASSGKINDVTNIINVSVTPNEKHSLKMVVQGATIICYFDGIKMFDVTDKNEPYMTGYAGVRSVSGTAKSSFDYFAVREIGTADIVKDPSITKQDGDIWFYDNFTGEESMTERGWNTDKVELYKRSALVKSRVVISNVKDSDKWTDYEVSAIVFVDKEAGMYQDTSSGAAAICARTVSSNTGYEFGILTSPTAASYLRLNDRTNDKVIATDKTIPITSGEHTLRMVCIGNEISCYFDDMFVFTVQSDAAANGYAGMRANSYNAYFKEFTVRKARPVATILPSGPVSPSTGDNGMNMAVVYAAAVVCSLSMIGFVVTAFYSRKKYV